MSQRKSSKSTKSSTSKSSSKSSKSSTGGFIRALGTLVGAILVAIIAFLTNNANNSTSTADPTRANIRGGRSTQVPSTVIASNLGNVNTLSLGQGFGYERGFWQVYFDAPTGSTRRADYVGGVDEVIARTIDAVEDTLDIVAYEFNSPAITTAVLAANRRGVTVRMVTDTDGGFEDDSTVQQLVSARIPVVDDQRSAIMHDKFMILDSTILWTGTGNYTVNDVYRNNNSYIQLRSPDAIEYYQAEFDEMFTDRSFGPRSPAGNTGTFTQDGVTFGVYFAPENDVDTVIVDTLSTARRSIRFMAFSFTLDNVGAEMQNRYGDGVIVQGIFETTGSETDASELRPLLCAGMDVRQDGNPYFLHHKVFIIDERTVLIGSFNFSSNATNSNDENLLVITDPTIAALYTQEFERRWAEANLAANISCR
jgi:phosphatidylserine/phosphatidylglycerophosphate/cardiolipin synthase-like enzyme